MPTLLESYSTSNKKLKLGWAKIGVEHNLSLIVSKALSVTLVH